MTTGDDWLEQARRLAVGLGESLASAATSAAASAAADGADEGTADGPAVHGSDCRWCPLCAAVGVLRGERPELTTALADALGAAAAALRTLAAEPPRGPAGPAAGEPPDERPEDGVAGPVVQHIEIA